MSVSHILVVSPVAFRIAERLDTLMSLANNKAITDPGKRRLILDQSRRVIEDINHILRKPKTALLSLPAEVMVEVDAGMKQLRVERARVLARRAEMRREAAELAALEQSEPLAA